MTQALKKKLNFTLVDSINKKTSFLNTVVTELQLDNVKVERFRIEDFTEKCDFVIGRAVTNINDFYHLTFRNISNKNHNIIKNGIIYLTGSQAADSLQDFHGVVINNIKSVFLEEYFVDKKIVFIPKQ